jgi:hypothetical protein
MAIYLLLFLIRLNLYQVTFVSGNEILDAKLNLSQQNSENG